jgi:hypothetical protein
LNYPSGDGILQPLAAWRNWQTQQTQNLPEITLREGSTPFAATISPKLGSTFRTETKISLVAACFQCFSRSLLLLPVVANNARNLLHDDTR